MFEVESIKISSIIPSEYNPRLISNEEFIKLKNSIKEWGLVDPVIINLKNNHIIGGHQRFKVLKSVHEDTGLYEELELLRLGDIGWVFTKQDLKIDNESQVKGLNIALNKISGEWDYPKLNNLLEDLSLDTNFDITLTGFDSLDVSDMGLLDMDLDDFDIGSDDDYTSEDFIGRNKLELYVKFNDYESQQESYETLTNEGYACKIYN